MVGSRGRRVKPSGELNPRLCLNLLRDFPQGLGLAEIILDEKAKLSDFRWIWTNPAFEELTGITPQIAQAQTACELIPAISSQLIEIYNKMTTPGGAFSFEYRNPQSGRWLEINVHSPSPGYLLQILTEITLRKNAESARMSYLKELQSLSRAAATLVELPASRPDQGTRFTVEIKT